MSQDVRIRRLWHQPGDLWWRALGIRSAIGAIVASGLLTVSAPVAAACSSEQFGYSQIKVCACTGSECSAGTLPFTGFQLGLIALVALGLLGLGLALRRFSGDRTA